MQTDSIVAEIMASVEKQVQDAIVATWKKAYAQGQHDANAKIRALLQLDEDSSSVKLIESEGQPLTPIQTDVSADIEMPISGSDAGAERKRAPKGLPRQFVTRVLTDRPDGASLVDILTMAQTDHERMIAPSTIRGELRKGREEGRYEERNNLWTLVLKEVSE